MLFAVRQKCGCGPASHSGPRRCGGRTGPDVSVCCPCPSEGWRTIQTRPPRAGAPVVLPGLLQERSDPARQRVELEGLADHLEPRRQRCAGVVGDEQHRQPVQAPRPPGPARRDGRGEADALPARAGAPVAQLHPLHRDRADPGLRQALRATAVPDHPLASVRQAHVLHSGQEGLGFRRHRLRQQPVGVAPQDGGQRAVDLVRLTERNNGGTARHRRIAPSGGSGRLVTRLDTPPLSPSHHPVSALARAGRDHS